MNGGRPIRRPRARLVDERSTPSVRHLLGGMMAHADAADFAVARIRLTGLDLSRDELGRLRRCRVVVGRVDAGTFADAELAMVRDPAGRGRLIALREFLASGRVRVRSAGTHLWAPDFSILHGPARGGAVAPAVVFVGCHYFGRPDPPGGAALTCLLTSPDAAALARKRFDEIWQRAYDVGPVVSEMLDGLLAGASPDGLARAHADADG